MSIAIVLACLAMQCTAEQYVTQFTIREPQLSGDALHAAVAQLLAAINKTHNFTLHEVPVDLVY